MGYPWGDESYPTIERLENGVDDLRSSFYTYLDDAQRDLERRYSEINSKKSVNVHIDVSGSDLSDDDVRSIIEESVQQAVESRYDDSPSLREMVDCYGLAFARMIYSCGIDDPDNDVYRLFQDLFNVLEDRVISQFDEIGSIDMKSLVGEHERVKRSRSFDRARLLWETQNQG